MSKTALLDMAESFKKRAWADSTCVTYATQLMCYSSFCEGFDYEPVPASSSMLQAYVAYLTGVKHLRYNTIRQYLAIISHIHKSAGFPDPLKGDYHLRQELMGVKRVLGVAQTPVDVITPQLVLAIRHSLIYHNIADMSFWCACLVAFFGLFRPGNVVVHGNFDNERDLRRVDALSRTWGLHYSFKMDRQYSIGRRW